MSNHAPRVLSEAGMEQQPGLEVVPQEHMHNTQQWPQATPENDWKEVGHATGFVDGSTPPPRVDATYWQHQKMMRAGAMPSTDPECVDQPPESTPIGKGLSRKRLWLIVGALLFVLVVVGAVVGGVLGSRAAANKSTSTSESQSTATPTTTASSPSSPTTTPVTLQTIRQGSALSVTGWRKTTGVEISLFYQDRQNGLRRSKYDTSLRTFSANESFWGASTSLTAGQPIAGTTLGASTLLFGTGCQPQTELFYNGPSTRVLGVNMNTVYTPELNTDSINDMQVFSGLNSSLAAYWPWWIYQSPDGKLVHIRNGLVDNFGPSATWSINTLNVTGLAATRLAIVPLSTNFSKIAVKGGYAVFYQDTNNRLAVSITDINSPELAPDYALSWPTNDFPSITLPKYSPIAAFSTARPSDKSERVNTYVLYLDAASDINMVYIESSNPSSWKTSKPDALKGADPDTDIACLTMATSNYNAAGLEVPLEQASSESKCFFQRGGVLIQAVLDGTDWVVNGTVPLS
ncbi:hypothetical protein B0T22DRAFT_298541 [Podospora appendiculata]|uniref:Fucose-specific lectin n=1 Tax=Podospora appendiculata TaxID=314037 RepID=A0AAE0WZU7_9PEZI|nr:hypothetical protein B0T22DRAFT_298541 [Podospora appendiculata]